MKKKKAKEESRNNKQTREGMKIFFFELELQLKKYSSKIRSPEFLITFIKVLITLLLFIIIKISLDHAWSKFTPLVKWLGTLFLLLFSTLILVSFFHKRIETFFHKRIENKLKLEDGTVVSKVNISVGLSTLFVMVILTVGIYLAQIPSPDVSYKLSVDSQTGILDLYFFNTGDRAVILSSLEILEIGSSPARFNRGLPLMLSPFSGIQLISTNEKINANKEYVINYCYEFGESKKCDTIGPKPLKNAYESSVGLSITLSDSVSVSVTRYRNSSVIVFEEKKLEEYETVCYIENEGGNPEKFVIEDLNYSTGYIPPHEKFEFPCQIRNGEVYKILEGQ